MFIQYFNNFIFCSMGLVGIHSHQLAPRTNMAQVNYTPLKGCKQERFPSMYRKSRPLAHRENTYSSLHQKMDLSGLRWGHLLGCGGARGRLLVVPPDLRRGVPV